MGVPRAARKVGRRKALSGRGAWGNMSGNRARGEAVSLRFRARPCANQSVNAAACHRRLDSLMTYMANGASVGGKIGMMMPDLTDRRP